jgi:hypothetical protein
MKLFEIASPQSLIVVALTKLLQRGEKVYLEIFESDKINASMPRNYRMLVGSAHEGFISRAWVEGDGSNGNAQLLHVTYGVEAYVDATMTMFASKADDVLDLSEKDGVWKLTNETF